jgi:hypothetical protein
MKYNQQITELVEYFTVLKALGQPVDLYTYAVHYDHRVVANVRRALLQDFSLDNVWKSTLLEFFTMLENVLGDHVFTLYQYCTLSTKNTWSTLEVISKLETPINVNALTIGMVISLHKLITRT